MAATHLLYITAIITLTSCQKLPTHAVTSIMQDILSPKNTEQLSQQIKRAANGRMSELQMPNKRNVIMEPGVQRNLARNEIVQEVMMPRNEKAGPKLVMKRPDEVVLSKRILVQNAMPNAIIVQKHNEGVTPVNVVMQKTNDFNTPTNIVIRKPECNAMTNKVLVQKPEVSNRRIIVQKANEIPMLRNLMLQNGNAVTSQGSMPNSVVVTPNEGSQVARSVSEINTSRALVQQPKVVGYASEKVVSLNPFLPVASPGSTISALPQSKGQFLRKIPIPPPTI